MAQSGPVVDTGPGFLEGLARVIVRVPLLAGIAEHEFAWPDQFLARLALLTVVGILPNGEHVIGGRGETPAHPWLGDTIQKTEMFVPREDLREVCPALFALHYTGGVREIMSILQESSIVLSAQERLSWRVAVVDAAYSPARVA